jgi:lycopene beta-cyclase
VSSSLPITCDIAIVGGGLAGSLIALALAEKRPDLDVRIIEASPSFGGNHLWSFFDSDIAAQDRWLIEPLICYQWQGYDIVFPAHARTVDARYNSIESERLDQIVRGKLGVSQIIAARVSAVATGCVTLTDGRSITARHVIDARGPGDIDTLEVGWQKFVGQSLKVPGGHGLMRPIVMDASVDQIDGYRFVYCLPFDAETVFVEDTYYSDGPDLDAESVRTRIAAYAKAKGWATAPSNAREEQGVLPVVIGGDFDAYWASTGQGVAKAGLRSGMFHATTGYSLPDAVRLAVQMPMLVDLPAQTFATQVASLAKGHWRSRWFYRMLDAMLFYGSTPPLRYKVLERFYRLSPGLIARFYAGQSTAFDKVRILSGKPPIPIGRAAGILIRQAYRGLTSKGFRS